MKKKFVFLLAAVASMALLAGCSDSENENSNVEHVHTWATDWSKDETSHWHICTDESCEVKNEEGAHSGGTATCTTKAECEDCGVEYGTTAAHVYDQETVNEEFIKTGATCTSGAIYYKSCVCGAVDKSETAATFVNGDPVAHTPQTDDGDCTTPILCSECRTELTSAKTHVVQMDDGDCTTAIFCANENCTQVVVKGQTAHTFGGDYLKDEDGHWQACTNQDCRQENSDQKVAHSSDSFDEEGKADCTVCGLTFYKAVYYSTNDAVRIAKVTEGENSGKWEVTGGSGSNNISQANGIRFVDLQSFFAEKNTHITFKMKGHNINALSICIQVNGVGTTYDWIYKKPQFSGQNLLNAYDNVRIFDEYMNPVIDVQDDRWYTVSIFVDYDAEVAVNLENVNISFGIQGANDQAASMYLENPVFGKAFPTVENPYYTKATENATIEKVTEGDFAGTWKASGSNLEWSNGVKLTDLAVDGDFYTAGYQNVQFKMYIEAGQAIEFSYGITTTWGPAVTSGWQNLDAAGGASIVSMQSYVTFYDASGNKVDAITKGQWYTVNIYMWYDLQTVVAEDLYFGLQAQNGSAVMYFSDPVYFTTKTGGSATDLVK